MCGFLAYCGGSDLVRYRIPNRALLGAAVFWAAGIGIGAVQNVGGSNIFGDLAKAYACFGARVMFGLLLGFPFFYLRMTGAGDVKLMALLFGCFGLKQGAMAVWTGLCLGALWALEKMLREGSMLCRFSYMFSYLKEWVGSGEAGAYYCLERDGKRAVIPMGACFVMGTVMIALTR